MVADQATPPSAFPAGPHRVQWERRPRRALRTAVGLVVGAVIVGGISVGIAVGPRSSKGSGALSGAPPGYRVHSVFVPTSPIPHGQMVRAARTVYGRLRALGDTDVAVTCCGSEGSPGSGPSIGVSSPRPLTPAERAVALAPGSLLIRPVLCGAPDHETPPPSASPGTSTSSSSSRAVPACDPADQTTVSNLGFAPNAQSTDGYTSNSIPADPVFASYPSTPPQNDDPSATVVLPADPAAGTQQYPRFVLGPAQMRGDAVAGASAVFDRSLDQWAVNVALTASGSAQFDRAANGDFHQYMAIDLDGAVLSAPVIQPTQTQFSSFQGQLVISGDFSAAEARDVAAVIGNGVLPVSWTLRSVLRVAVHS